MDLDTAQDNPESTESVTSEQPAQSEGVDAFDEFSKQFDEMHSEPAEAEAAPAQDGTDNEPAETPSEAVAAPAKDLTDMNASELKAWIDANPNNAKSYAHIQAAFTRASQESANLKRELDAIGGIDAVQRMAEEYQWLHQTLAQNPEKLNAVRAILGTQENQVPEGLSDDPLYQHLSPEMQQLKQTVMQQQQYIQQQQYQAESARVEAQVDQALNQAYSRFKAHFGKEPTKEDKTQIIRAMQERKIYDHTDALVDNLYMDKVMEAKVQAALKAQSEKVRKNPSMRTVNSSAATEGPAMGAMDPYAAWDQAIADFEAKGGQI